MSGLKQTDQAADHLLDFIAGGVPTNEYGESAGNYNATFGDIDGSVHGDLSKKTLVEIYDMQDAMLADNGISTATGRYQALKGTLQEYQDRTGLADGDLFTEHVQDGFGLGKMNDRGYKSWQERSISDDEFMHRLSCEWASLPDPYNGGKSHYDGDSAGNHASTSLEHFQAALTEARALMGAGIEVVDRMPPDQGIREIQRILVLTGDLSADGVDGAWGPISETALNNLISRD
jgi:muramidase (phage lysozyme)